MDIKNKYIEIKKDLMKIFESPDEIRYFDKNIFFTEAEKGTICFSYYEGEMKALKNYTHDELFKSKYGYYPEEKYNHGRGDYAGRIYIGEKILTFWHFPENREIMKGVVEDLERETGLEIWNNYYFVEIPKNIPKKEDRYWSDREETEYVALEDYKGTGIKYNVGYDVPHNWKVYDPRRKKRMKPEMFGSKSDKRSLKWKQALLKSESRLNESPDFLIIDGFKIHYEEGYAFGFVDGEFLFIPKKTHFYFKDEKRRPYTRDGMDYPGRFWKLETGNYISFWEYPDPDKLKEILSLIGRLLRLDNYMDINIELPKNTKYINKRLKSSHFSKADSVFVNFEEYKKIYKGIKGFDKSIQHLMDWEEKQKIEKPETFGSKSDKRPLKWKQALLKSEKINNIMKVKKFNEFLNENLEEKKDWFVTLETNYTGTEHYVLYKDMTLEEAERNAYQEAREWAESYSNVWESELEEFEEGTEDGTNNMKLV